MKRFKSSTRFAIMLTGILFLASFAPYIYAQNLDSGGYTLIDPSIGPTASGAIDSANYSQLMSAGLLDDTTFTSTNYALKGGLAQLIEANVPSVSCFEANSNFGNTACTGVPGSDGMFGVCGDPGCYNRAKIEINAQGNPADARYAVQISTASDFSNNIFYVDATTRLLKTTLSVSDFIPKCEWEGTTVSGVCASANTTWHKYNVLGLNPDTTYYVRLAAARGLDSSNNFTQSAWGPSASDSTAKPTINFDIDIAPNTSTSTNVPYNLSLGSLNPTSVNTSNDNIIMRTSTNGLGGLQVNVKGNLGYLYNTATSDQIPAYNGDLSSNTGYGIRNNSLLNSADNTANLGDITVSSSPVDFTDTGAAAKVGGPSTSYVKLFDSNSKPLDNGIAAFVAKAKPSTTAGPGSYSELLTFVVYATF